MHLTALALSENDLPDRFETGDIGIPEEIDRLLGIADNEEAVRRWAGYADDREDDVKLRGIGVLELVDEDIPEPWQEMGGNEIFIGQEQLPGVQDQVLEIKSPKDRLFPLNQFRVAVIDEREISQEVNRTSDKRISGINRHPEETALPLQDIIQLLIGRFEQREVVSLPYLPAPGIPRALCEEIGGGRTEHLNVGIP